MIARVIWRSCVECATLRHTHNTSNQHPFSTINIRDHPFESTSHVSATTYLKRNHRTSNGSFRDFNSHSSCVIQRSASLRQKNTTTWTLNAGKNPNLPDCAVKCVLEHDKITPKPPNIHVDPHSPLGPFPSFKPHNLLLTPLPKLPRRRTPNIILPQRHHPPKRHNPLALF